MIVSSVLVLSGLGLSAAVILAAASRMLHVEEDPRIARVESVLPGANCGGCGFPGCSGAAAAIVAGKAPVDVCVAGNAEVTENVARIMGQTVERKEPQVAMLRCIGGDRAHSLYNYQGVEDCRAQYMFYGGNKICGKGCLGLGSCVAACPFDALSMGPEGLPVVDTHRCRACGKCAKVCPVGIINIVNVTMRMLYHLRMDDCLAPCRQKCPAQLNVPLFIKQIRLGKLHEALLTLKERNPLPMSVGRICPHPCENICRRKIVDEGVAIHTLERYLGDWEMTLGKRLVLSCAPDTGREIAIVGGGPAGLACAYFLRRAGHKPTIFDAKPKLGGLLQYCIPEYRLPRKILDWEIQGILDLGVIAKTNVHFGRDIHLHTLRALGFDAVVLATGAWNVPSMGIPGEDLEGVVPSIEFLTRVGSQPGTLAGKRVVVIGGTNTAMDVARSAVRLEARSVTVLFPDVRTRMSANKRDIDLALECGIQILFLAGVRQMIPGDSGSVAYVEYDRYELQGEGKKSKPVLIPDSATRIEADRVVVALKRCPDLAGLCSEITGCRDLKTSTATGTVAADEDTLLTNLPDVYVCGEAYSGRSWMIDAVEGGRKVARSIHYKLTTGAIPVPENLQKKVVTESILRDVKIWHDMPRVRVKRTPVEDRRKSFVEEVQQSITDREAAREASRCLHCGITCYDYETQNQQKGAGHDS
jgi:NADPH-dependent glutamate synthase beta subunit-like oxidoreductase/Pyruvate/2-oxoacid:ferredoxin oxidoreductase delta subunit